MHTLIEAKERIPSQREQILNMLRVAGGKGVTNIVLKDLCVRWNSRMHELYQQGYVIDVRAVEDGVYKYILIREPEAIRPKPAKALKLVMAEIDKKFEGNVTSDNLQSLLEEMGLNIVRKANTHRVAAR